MNLTREAKGRDLADSGAVRATDAGYTVGSYSVDSDVSSCSCADYQYRNGTCKHMFAVGFAAETDQVVYADLADSPF